MERRKVWERKSSWQVQSDSVTHVALRRAKKEGPEVNTATVAVAVAVIETLLQTVDAFFGVIVGNDYTVGVVCVGSEEVFWRTL